MRVDVLGCRGSTPATGRQFDRYGGDTSALAITVDDGAPAVLLDAGTGLRHLGRLVPGHFQGTILLTHLHWDHTHGLPFSPPLDQPGSRVRLMLPHQHGDPEELMARAMSPPHFPIRAPQLRGDWTLSFLEQGEHQIEGLEVTAAPISHKGGVTFGYRVSRAGHSFAYMPDHSLEQEDGSVRLAEGVDVLIHDAMYDDAQQAERADFGHCSVSQAVAFAERAGVGELVLFHHDFNRTDDQMDRLVSEHAGGPVALKAAIQGMTIELRHQ